jgi:ferric-dicitrate binding protein FerR (iron transport regulator)
MACERVLQTLRAERALAPSPVPAAGRTRYRRTWRHLAVLGAFAALVLSILFTEIQGRRELAAVAGADAVVQAADGSLSGLAVGQILKTDSSLGRLLALADGSRVEVREQSELSLERADDRVRIRLQRGSVIVNAAEKSTRLSVLTKDLTVALAGTVFLVVAEQAGSRVAVIQGEVRVQQGTTEMNLTQGEQLATSPLLEPREVSEQIAWSRNAEIHLQQLQQSRKTIEELCGPTDLRSIVRENGGWNLRLPRVLWRKYKCQHERDSQ